MGATLMLHRGAVEVPRSEVEVVPAPPATKTWFPVPHQDVINTVEGRLQEAGFSIAKARYALSHKNHRLFATLDLAAKLAEGVTLSVGVRNSTDQTFPIGWSAGSRTFVCDNLSFQASTVISARHTRYGASRFESNLAKAITGLHEFRLAEERRISFMQQDELTDERANSLMLQSFERRIVNSRLLPKVIREYRSPRHDEFLPRTAWSLLAAYTEVLKERLSAPAEYALTTIKLQGLLCREPPHIAT